MQTHRLNSKDALRFILAGHALFTIKKISTGGRFTYKVSIPHDQKPEEASIFFISVLTGSDNENDYKYFGYIRNNIFTYGGAKAKVGRDAPSVKVFETVWRWLLIDHPELSKLEIWHEGRCGRCGRTLTVPESIENGIGPECSKIIASKYQLSL
jgi:hypothetical protein